MSLLSEVRVWEGQRKVREDGSGGGMEEGRRGTVPVVLGCSETPDTLTCSRTLMLPAAVHSQVIDKFGGYYEVEVGSATGLCLLLQLFCSSSFAVTLPHTAQACSSRV